MVRELLFHGIGTPQRALEPGERDVWVQQAELTEILDLVRGQDVRISVDDGNRSDVDIMLPALVERGLTATFFPIAGRIDTTGSLSAEAIRELRDAGMAIGSHGLRHRPWRRLDTTAISEELIQAREILEDTVQLPIVEAACPRGAYDRRALKALRRLGYRRVFTSDRGPSRESSWVRARDSVRRWDDASSIERTVLQRPAIPELLMMQVKRTVKRLR